MYARIVDGRVAEVLVEFPALMAGEVALIVECSTDALPGWLFLGGECVAPPAPDPNADVDAQITALEASVTQRRLREAALTEDGRAWLADVDGRIAALRTQRV